MRCERRKRRHIKTLAQMFSLLVEELLLGKRANVERPDQSREVDMIIGENLIKMSAYCRQKGHWKKDCPILKEKGSNSNVVRDDDTNTDNALTISLSVSQTSE